MVKKEHNRHDPKRRRRSTNDNKNKNQYHPDAAVSISSSLNNQPLSSSVVEQKGQPSIYTKGDKYAIAISNGNTDNNYVASPSSRDASKYFLKIDARDVSNLLGTIDNYHQAGLVFMWTDDDEHPGLVTADGGTVTTPAVLQALEQLQDEIGRRFLVDKLEQFHCLGGITRVLQLLDTAVTIITHILRRRQRQIRSQNIDQNTLIVGAVTKFLSFLLSLRWKNLNATANANASTNTNTNTNPLEVSMNNNNNNTGNNKTKIVALEMAKMVARRNGIELLLRCCCVNNDDNYTTASSLLTTKQHIWTVLGRTMNINNELQQDETGTGMNVSFVDKRQQLCILHQATTDCISILEKMDKKQQQNNTTTTTTTNGSSMNTNIMTMHMDLLQVMLYTIANAIKDDSLEKEELKQTNIKSVCLRLLLLLKKKNSSSSNTICKNNNNNNEEVVTYTLGILTILTRKKVLSKKNDFEQLLPTLVYCLTSFQGNNNHHQIRSFVLILLELSCTKLDTQTMEEAGVLEAIPAVLLGKKTKSSNKNNNDDDHNMTAATATTVIISEETKEKARSIMRKILKY